MNNTYVYTVLTTYQINIIFDLYMYVEAVVFLTNKSYNILEKNILLTYSLKTINIRFYQ